MKHDDGSHGCMREEDKKIEVANKAPMSKPQGSNPNAQTPPKLLSKPAT